MVVLLAQPTVFSSSPTSCITVWGLCSHRQLRMFHSLAVSLTSSMACASLSTL